MKSYSELLELQFMSLTRISLRLREELEKTTSHLKMEFETKDLGNTRLCLDHEVEALFLTVFWSTELNYTPKVSPLSIPFIVYTLYTNETLEEVMESKIPYLKFNFALRCI